MELTAQSMGFNVFMEGIKSNLNAATDAVIALAGNPNTGKSTLFNALTGLNQHTGNWPGKTVILAKGNYVHRKKRFVLVDLPGAYSLLANSEDEKVTRDFICFAEPNATIVVVDATCLERNLNLALQVAEIVPQTILCVNLLDQAEQKGLRVDCRELERLSGLPCVPVIAREKRGLDRLRDVVNEAAFCGISRQPRKIIYDESVEKAILQLQPRVEAIYGNKINSRWLALQILQEQA